MPDVRNQNAERSRVPYPTPEFRVLNSDFHVPSSAGRRIFSIPGGMDVRYRASRYLSASGRLAFGPDRPGPHLWALAPTSEVSALESS